MRRGGRDGKGEMAKGRGRDEDVEEMVKARGVRRWEEGADETG